MSKIGAKGGSTDKKRTLKIKKSVLKKLKEINLIENKDKINKLLQKKKLNNIIIFNYLQKIITGEKNHYIEKPKEFDITENYKINFEKEKKVINIKSVKDDTKKQTHILDNLLLTTVVVGKVVKEVNDTLKFKEELPIENEYEKEKITSLENYKILEEYENKLISSKKELTELLKENEILNKITKEKNIDTNIKETKKINEKLDILLNKVSHLKDKLEKEEYKNIKDNYIYNQIQDYIKEFNEGKENLAIKYSSIYIELSKKIKYIENNNKKIKTKHQDKKKNIDKDLLKQEQETQKLTDENEVLDYLYNKIIKNTNDYKKDLDNIKDITQSKLKYTKNLTNTLILILGINLFLPATQEMKKTLTLIILGVMLLKGMNKNKNGIVDLEKIEKIKEKIDDNIYELDDLQNKIEITSKNIKEIENDLLDKYDEYKNIPEYEEILDNIIKIKISLKEKQYDIKQEKQKNNENKKVLNLTN